jgi:tRNA(Ile)-lysidine synthase
MGRELRYGVFREVASRFSRSYVDTAHTATDNAETLLFHLCRGCGLHGLTGIPPVRDTIIRPLIDCSRGEIEDYCRINHLCYTTDSTNEDTTCTRNRIRHDVLPILKRVHPAADRSIQRLIAHMREVDAFLEREADTYWENIKTNERGIYRKSSLSSLDPVIQTRLLQRMLHEWDITPDDLHLQQMQECLKTDGVVTLQSGVCFAVSKDRICISPKTPKICVTDETMTIIPGTVVCFGGENYRITVISRKEYEQKLNISKFVFKNVCDYDTICGDLVLRKRQAGDTYHPAGRHCGKTFKKLFNESSVLPEKRDRIPILCDNDGVILVFGFGCDERVRITDGTEKILMIEKIKE